jgi:IS5 family transposase
VYLQYFCGYPEYNDEKLPFDPSLMVYFRKRLTPEILGEINEMIINKAQTGDDSDNEEPPANNGTLIVDATCAPSQIKYPQDTELLNEARKNTESMIDSLHKPTDGKKPRTYRKKAHKHYLSVARKKKKNKREIRKAIKKQLSYLERNISIIESYQAKGRLRLGLFNRHYSEHILFSCPCNSFICCCRSSFCFCVSDSCCCNSDIASMRAITSPTTVNNAAITAQYKGLKLLLHLINNLLCL